MASDTKRIITLTTDFGTKDYYVASMKAAIWAVNPDANIVDITHDIPPHDLLAAGFTLRCAFQAVQWLGTTYGFNTVGPEFGKFTIDRIKGFFINVGTVPPAPFVP